MVLLCQIQICRLDVGFAGVASDAERAQRVDFLGVVPHRHRTVGCFRAEAADDRDALLMRGVTTLLYRSFLSPSRSLALFLCLGIESPRPRGAEDKEIAISLSLSLPCERFKSSMVGAPPERHVAVKAAYAFDPKQKSNRRP